MSTNSKAMFLLCKTYQVGRSDCDYGWHSTSNRCAICNILSTTNIFFRVRHRTDRAQRSFLWWNVNWMSQPVELWHERRDFNWNDGGVGWWLGAAECCCLINLKCSSFAQRRRFTTFHEFMAFSCRGTGWWAFAQHSMDVNNLCYGQVKGLGILSYDLGNSWSLSREKFGENWN